MANKFTNFLKGFLEGGGNLRDYQHAARLYVDDYYKLAPKAGWLYYIVLNINQSVFNNSPVINDSWRQRYGKNIGILAKSADFPSFSMATQVVNQYNRKTVVQTGITYNPIRIVFHNDMENVTNELWRAYYNYYYTDGRYGQVGGGGVPISDLRFPKEFLDNKLTPSDEIPTIVRYGLNNFQDSAFFDTIKIYTLNRQRYSSVTLVNPLVSQWNQSNLNQDASELLDSTMTVTYESVFYNNANTKITKNDPGFTSAFYDNSPSPLSIGGGGVAGLLGPSGVLAGASEVFGEIGQLNANSSPLAVLNTALKARNLAKNASNLTKAGIKAEGKSVLNNLIAGAAVTGILGSPITQTANNLGASAINFFKKNAPIKSNITPSEPVSVSGTRGQVTVD